MAGEANGARASPGGHATLTHNNSSPGSERDSEVNSTIDLLDTEVRELYAALDNQKRRKKQLESVRSLGLSWLVLERNLVRMSALAAYPT